jgi:hypothetical protein
MRKSISYEVAEVCSCGKHSEEQYELFHESKAERVLVVIKSLSIVHA